MKLMSLTEMVSSGNTLGLAVVTISMSDGLAMGTDTVLVVSDIINVVVADTSGSSNFVV